MSLSSGSRDPNSLIWSISIVAIGATLLHSPQDRSRTGKVDGCQQFALFFFSCRDNPYRKPSSTALVPVHVSPGGVLGTPGPSVPGHHAQWDGGTQGGGARGATKPLQGSATKALGLLLGLSGGIQKFGEVKGPVLL